MTSVFNGLSSERLEQEIARAYWEWSEYVRSHYFRTGVGLSPTVNEVGLMAEMWAEFDARMEAETISADTDWTEDDDDL